MNNEAVYIYIAKFCIFTIFWFNIIIPNSWITILLKPNIDKP